jgi:spermidine/putrescine transport system ATP-binding protein
VMNGGKIEQLGAPTAMYEFPATPFVANFLGQSNLVAVEAGGHSGDDVLVTGHDNRFALPAGRCRVTAGSAWLGVRPEKLHLLPSGEPVPAGHGSLAGVVTDSSYIGVSTQYLVRVPWGEELSVCVPNSGVAAPLLPGAEVSLYWRPEHAFLLERPPGEEVAPALIEVSQ